MTLLERINELQDEIEKKQNKIKCIRNLSIPLNSTMEELKEAIDILHQVKTLPDKDKFEVMRKLKELNESEGKVYRR